MISPKMALPLLLACAAVSARGGADLPPRIAALVPAGARLVSGNFTGTPAMAVASFTAERRLDVTRTVGYSLEVRAFDDSSPTWRMKESAFRAQTEARIAEVRNRREPESILNGVYTADPVQETKKPWGSALTQRISMHPPRAKAYVEYSCDYLGMVRGIVVKLHAHGVPDSPGEADQWAESVFQAAAGLTVSNIGGR